MSDEWRRRPRFWTDEKLAILKAEYPIGTHMDEIARLIGCTAVAAQAKAIALKLPRKPSQRPSRQKSKVRKIVCRKKGFWTLERVLYLVDAYDRGQHVLAIAAKLGCSKGAVVGKAYRLNLEHPNAGLGVEWSFNPSSSLWKDLAQRRAA